MRKCPHCQKKLHPTYRDRGVIHLCKLCSGSLVRLDVLEREQVSRTFLEDVKEFARAVGPPVDNVRCPDCSRPMREINIWSGSGVLNLRVCQTCSQIWLKDGERRKLPDHSGEQLTYFERPGYSLDSAPELEVAPCRRASFERPARGIEVPQPLLPPVFFGLPILFVPVLLPLPMMLPVPMSGSELTAAKGTAMPPKGFMGTLGGLLGIPGETASTARRHLPILSTLFAVVIFGLSLASTIFQQFAQTLQLASFNATSPSALGGATWFSSLFVHSNLLVAFIVAIVFSTFGARLENSISRFKLLLLILLAHAGGLFATLSVTPGTNFALGATSAAVALFAFYVVQFPHARLALAPLWGIHPVWLDFPAMGAASIFAVIMIALSQYVPHESVLGLFSIHALVGIGIGVAFSLFIRSRSN